LARKCKNSTNPPKKLKRSKGAVGAEPKKFFRRPGFSPHFSEMSDKLFCDACREILSLKKHAYPVYKVAKHVRGLKNLASRSARQNNISDMLNTCDKDVHPSGGEIPRRCANLLCDGSSFF